MVEYQSLRDNILCPAEASAKRFICLRRFAGSVRLGTDGRRKTAEGKAMSFERGSTVLCRDFGEGVVINLPIHNKIVVRFPDGIVRYFWPDDVASGAIQVKQNKN